jgi:hypothetical protein
VDHETRIRMDVPPKRRDGGVIDGGIAGFLGMLRIVRFDCARAMMSEGVRKWGYEEQRKRQGKIGRHRQRSVATFITMNWYIVSVVH